MGDLKYAVRRLLQYPGFAVVVIATLAVGIGATTAIFSLVQAVLLRPLPYPEPERLVTTFHFYPSLNNLEAGFAVPTYRDLGQRTHLFEYYAVLSGNGMTLTGKGEAQRLDAVQATADYFRVLGVEAAQGRTFAPGEDQLGHDHVAVLSHAFWSRNFGADRGVVGRTLQLNGEPYTVVGVMPETFRDARSRSVDVWTPLAFQPEMFADSRRTNEFLGMFGRLRRGVSVDQASRDMMAFAESLKHDFKDSYPPNWSIHTRALAEQGRKTVRPALLVLLGAVAAVLLIACANLANLLLARATGRTRELAVRTAIGATRGRLIAQLLTESVALSVVGGVLGVALAYWLVRGLVAWNPSNLPWLADVSLDTTVLLFALLLAVVTGLVFGALPAVYASKADLNTGLREGGRSGADSVRGQFARRLLVVCELALALALLVGAGLLIRSFDRLVQVSPGFVSDHLLTFVVSPPKAKYPKDEDLVRFYDEVVTRMAAVGGVESLGATDTLPFSGDWSTTSFTVEGYQPPKGQPSPWGDVRAVTPGYHATMHIRLLRGRLLTDADRTGSRQVTVVDDETVRRYWPNSDPIGKRITFDDTAKPPVKWIEVVGVVAHTAHEGLDAERRVQLYFAQAQFPSRNMWMVTRAAGDPMALTPDLRRALAAVDRDVPLYQVRTMDDLMETAVGQRRLAMVLLGGFASIALLLAALGIFGVMSYDVTRRTQELGLRMALGADRRSVLTMIVANGLRLVAAGLAIGLVLAFAGGRLIESQLFGITTSDPSTFVGVALVLAAVAAVAILVPAMRATRVDPMEALRYE